MTIDPTTIDPQILARVEQLANDRGCTVGELLVDAMLALKDVEQRQAELRTETRRRVATAGCGMSQPLDSEAFRAEALRRHGLNRPDGLLGLFADDPALVDDLMRDVNASRDSRLCHTNAKLLLPYLEP